MTKIKLDPDECVKIEARAIFIKSLPQEYFLTGVAQYYLFEQLLLIGKKLGGNKIVMYINDIPSYKKLLDGLSYEEQKKEEHKRAEAPHLISSFEIEGLEPWADIIWKRFLKTANALKNINAVMDTKLQYGGRPKNIAKTIACSSHLIRLGGVFELNSKAINKSKEHIWERLDLKAHQNDFDKFLDLEKKEYKLLCEQMTIRGQKKTLEKIIKEIKPQQSGEGEGGRTLAQIHKI